MTNTLLHPTGSNLPRPEQYCKQVGRTVWNIMPEILKPPQVCYKMRVGYLLAGSQNVIVYATVNGLIIGMDLRSPNTVWKLKNDPKLGELHLTYFKLNETKSFFFSMKLITYLHFALMILRMEYMKHPDWSPLRGDKVSVNPYMPTRTLEEY